jgi:hypothetical protein
MSERSTVARLEEIAKHNQKAIIRASRRVSQLPLNQHQSPFVVGYGSGVCRPMAHGCVHNSWTRLAAKYRQSNFSVV